MRLLITLPFGIGGLTLLSFLDPAKNLVSGFVIGGGHVLDVVVVVVVRDDNSSVMYWMDIGAL